MSLYPHLHKIHWICLLRRSRFSTVANGVYFLRMYRLRIFQIELVLPLDFRISERTYSFSASLISRLTSWRKWRYAFQGNLLLNCFEVHDFSVISMLFFADCVTIHYINQTMYWNPILKWLTLFVTVRNWLKIKIHSLTAILFPTFVGESEFKDVRAKVF